MNIFQFGFLSSDIYSDEGGTARFLSFFLFQSGVGSGRI